MTAATAVLLAAAAVALVVGSRPAVAPAVPDARDRLRRLLPVMLVGVAACAVATRPAQLAVVLVGAGAVAAGARLLARRRADRAAAHLRARVVELCEGLNAELAAGQTAPAALQRVAEDWPLLEPVARTARTGGDVPRALRDLAGLPGAGDLRVVAAAWQVAHRTGHGLGDTVARVAAELRAGEQTRRVVAGELASARATARLVACLPVAALVMGTGAGSDPWSFLLAHPVGLACLAGGLACGLAGLAWIEAIARDVDRGR